MAEHTSKLSVFSRIVTSSLLVLSYTFVQSWDSAACQENAVRTSRLLTSHTLIGNTQAAQYPYLKNEVMDFYDEEYDTSEECLNQLVHREARGNTFSNRIHEGNFQRRSYYNLDASCDVLRGTNEIKRGLQKKSKGTNSSLDIDYFYDDEDAPCTSTSKELARCDKSISSRKYITPGLKGKTSTESRLFDYKPEENFGTLKKLIIEASAAEPPSKDGIIVALKKFDKKFEVELLRSVYDKALSDYDECKYKTGKRKYKHFMRKFRVFLPPTMNMALLMLMLVFQSTLFFTGIFSFLSCTLFTMMSYYGYKFAKIQKMRTCYRNFVKNGTPRKQIKYEKNYF
ncbi:Plasmodium exported protein, unknown function [Plasmodium knowlesi strain H]|uniref:Pv-fam-d protein n=3 Tax=Plasmodium knowlesi TaxID=5850 RepID=A0A5K1U283_PLAKH|nr:Plasmodium exported protein, unknown function [Plasmodium knowlesi strain H]OTN68598.1 Uncharacterized protein PKNOH_S02313900 [Plasmodium knowlesi]CAA9986638.1 Plasmodium exported protein, unknown function [Plasmodium knowlesi strain H]SBO24080.1 Plasmodium exported protein, unknown function [Plasmodium knowlesi strain H]SBO29348.1 Plasmodium exported protein, unknown function [Plasmodium knowlesi strain H]VVS76112.1 Plasmodium exported protein, unknown function [Plasmodium knowlesi strain|eukprot:XP_002261178.1 hypothetical protein, conserved in Plasmodium species [Plasmodium knowlesi strain H]